jgi:protein SCO1/2
MIHAGRTTWLRLLTGALLASALPASAQQLGGTTARGTGRQEEFLKAIRIDQKLNAQLPLDLAFRNEEGRAVRLHEYFGRKPVMFMLLQYRCEMLCTQQMQVLLASLKRLQFTPGRDFELIIFTIDPRETPDLAARQKQSYLSEYGRPEAAAGWHYLLGDQATITRLADAVGFRYEYHPETDQYAHPDGVILATPAGKIAQYYFQLNYNPRDLRLGLVEASQSKIGSPLDALALLCFHYHPTTGKYGLALLSVLRLSGLVTVLVLGVGIVAMKRRERQRRRPAGPLAA